VAEQLEENKGYRNYSTKWKDRDAQLIIARLQAGMLIGQIYVVGEQVYELRGSVAADGKFVARVIEATSKQDIGSIKGTLNKDTKSSFTIEEGQKPKQYLHCNLEQVFLAKTIDASTQAGLIDAIYPITKSEALNTLLQNRTENWMSIAKNQAQAGQQSHATAWSYITWWEDNLIVMMMTYQTSADSTPQNYPILFNIKKKQEIKITDLFQERFDAETWFKAQVMKQKPGIANYQTDATYATWLDNQGFPVQYLRNDGIVLASPFHAIYGVAEILLPWSVLKPYLKSNGVLKGLVK
jgi:hypothetical protein